MSPVAFRQHLGPMKPTRVRRRAYVHSLGDLEIIERGDVVSETEFAGRGPAPPDIVSCDIVIQRQPLGDGSSPSSQPMRLRVPREWLQRAVGSWNSSEAGSSQPDAVAVGDLTLLHLSHVARRIGTAHENHAPSWLRTTCRRIVQNVRIARLPALARIAGVHPVHLSRTFRRFFGTTFTKARHTLRLQHATEAIIHTSRPIAQIAVDHGFSDQGHLTRALTKATGLTPGYLRRKARTSAARTSRGGAE